VIVQGLRPVAIGIALGLVIAAAAGQLIATLLYGVTATDAMTYGVTLTAVALSATLACWLPARKAAMMEPAVSLRS